MLKLLGGVGVYDAKAGKRRALTLIFDGRFRNDALYDSPARFGVMVGWSQ